MTGPLASSEPHVLLLAGLGALLVAASALMLVSCLRALMRRQHARSAARRALAMPIGFAGVGTLSILVALAIGTH